MGDFESEPTPAGRATASVAFARAVAGVDSRCAQLTARLDTNDLDHVVHVARSAMNLWLTARAACRRLASREPPPSVKAARRCLAAAHARLLSAIARAADLVPASALGGDLESIRRELAEASARPSDDTAATTEDDTQDMAVDE